METPILQTKLYIPQSRHGAVPRPGLVAQLSNGLRGKLILISAPAGFGKTTLVSSWIGDLHLGAGQENQIVNQLAWLSLDDELQTFSI